MMNPMKLKWHCRGLDIDIFFKTWSNLIVSLKTNLELQLLWDGGSTIEEKTQIGQHVFVEQVFMSSKRSVHATIAVV
jgi:7,8-dihydro-6-hydroxymethylpterin-pyrophosphokinase